MKKIALLLSLVLLALCALTACGKYVSHYSAVGRAISNRSDSASMSFYKYRGTEVFKMKCKSEAAKIRYSGKLEAGNLTVYYDCGDGKTALFSAGAGDEISGVQRSAHRRDGLRHRGDGRNVSERRFCF